MIVVDEITLCVCRSQDIRFGNKADAVHRTAYQACMLEESPEVNAVHQNTENSKYAGLSAPAYTKPLLVENKHLNQDLIPNKEFKDNDEILGQLEHECPDPHLVSHCRSSLTLHSWLGESLDPTLTAESFGLSMRDDVQQTVISGYPLDPVLLNSATRAASEDSVEVWMAFNIALCLWCSKHFPETPQ